MRNKVTNPFFINTDFVTYFEKFEGNPVLYFAGILTGAGGKELKDFENHLGNKVTNCFLSKLIVISFKTVIN